VLAPNASAPPDEVLALAAAVEALSEHPLADAVVRHARARGVAARSVDEFVSVPGKGARGRVAGREVVVGSETLMHEAGIDLDGLADAAARAVAHGRTLVYVAVDGRSCALLSVADPLKPEARETVAGLRGLGLEVVLLTGDSPATAAAVAAEAGIERFVAGVLPQGKAEEIRRLQALGQVVAMVGDGVNDAPALAQSDVGIALGTGTDVAVEASDVALMRDDLRGIVSAITLSRRTMRTMRQNLFWAFVYNVFGIPIAAGALYPASGILLSPILASAAMALSSVSVVTNSLRLRHARIA
jgi:P-type Cu+ transporter